MCKHFFTSIYLLISCLCTAQTDTDGFVLLNDKYELLGLDTIPVFTDTICKGTAFKLSVHKGGAEKIHYVKYTVQNNTYEAFIVNNIFIDSVGTFQIKVEVEVTTKDFQSKGFWIDYFFITIRNCPPAMQLIGPDNICKGECIQFSNKSENYPTQYQWSFTGAVPAFSTDSLPPPICYPDTGTFPVTLIVSNPAGADTAVQYVTVNPGPEPVEAVNSYVIKEGDEVTLEACARGSSYNWQPYVAVVLNQDTLLHIQPDETQLYQCTVATLNGCKVQCTYTVRVQSGLLLPTGFSPNGDGVNDALRILNTNITLQSFSVYNRWGERVFFTTTLQDGWDGTYKGVAQPLEVYIWVAEYTITKTGKRKTAKGNITLLR